LGQLVIEETTVPASVSAIAVDDRPLAESRRILLIYATDALNTGMTFTAPNRETLVALGKPPVLLRTGRLTVKLSGDHVAGMKVWALGLDGRRAEVVDSTSTDGMLSLVLDLGRQKTVSPFFELAVE
jgi:hypothetical protein